MRPRAPFELPLEQAGTLERAKRLEWATLGAMAAVGAAMYALMGGSQAMKAA